MKKRIVVLLMACLVGVFLCGCGNEAASTNEAANTATTNTNDGGGAAPAETAQGDSDTVDLGDVVLFDDDYVTIKASQFFKKEWADRTDACFELKVTNNLDRDINFTIYGGDVYLGDEEVMAVSMDGNAGPAPGKTNQYTYTVSRQSGGEETPVESLDELYDLNGTITINVYSEDKSSIESEKDREYNFDFSQLK